MGKEGGPEEQLHKGRMQRKRERACLYRGRRQVAGKMVVATIISPSTAALRNQNLYEIIMLILTKYLSIPI